jgi:hypothetical protein
MKKKKEWSDINETNESEQEYHELEDRGLDEYNEDFGDDEWQDS